MRLGPVTLNGQRVPGVRLSVDGVIIEPDAEGQFPIPDGAERMHVVWPPDNQPDLQLTARSGDIYDLFNGERYEVGDEWRGMLIKGPEGPPAPVEVVGPPGAPINLQTAEGRDRAHALRRPLAELFGANETAIEFSFPKCKFNVVCREVEMTTLVKAAALCRVPPSNVSVMAPGGDELLVEIYLVPSDAWRMG